MRKRFPKKNLNREIARMETKEAKETEPLLTEKVRAELNKGYQNNIKVAIIKVKKRKQKP